MQRILLTDEKNNMLRENFRVLNNKRWCYSALITFRDGTEYADMHPFKAYKLFIKVFSTYVKKRKINYICFPEISKTGRFHCHLMLAFLETANDYNEHERILKLYKNFVIRKFGKIHTEERITNFYGSYTIPSYKCFNKTLQTTYEEKWKYMSKDRNCYIELQYISS